MKRRPPRPFPALPVALLLVAMLAEFPAHAQTATDLNEGLCLSANSATPGTYEVSWRGRAGYTYFLQRSEDLASEWGYFPLIETGRDAAVRYGFSTPAARIFVRLRLLETTLADPYGTDSDGDGLSNQEEFGLRTDLFALDTDLDGLPDAADAFPLDPSRQSFTGTLAVVLFMPANALVLP